MFVITFDINGQSSSSFIMYDEVFYIKNNWFRPETIRKPKQTVGNSQISRETFCTTFPNN